MDLTPEGLTRAAQRRGVPEHCISGLVRYVTDGVAPGDFLMAVLEGDLFEALGRADDTNIRALPEYGMFLWNDVPAICKGSPERVRAWINHNGMKGD
jgi:hypothetical protein